jgi:hypothetical protein
LFDVNPAFGFYDPAKLSDPVGLEAQGMNAFATTEGTDIPGTWGTVGFGWDLFRTEFYQHDNTGLTLMTIIAHEFGHILQYKRNLHPVLRTGFPRKIEINADFLAGYYLGQRKKKIPSLRFQRAGEFLIRTGRSDIGNPNRTHGDSQERLDAAEAGFRVSYVENQSLENAIRAGLEYVGL